jgi:tetratricopeptide (TPR) repeat protein
MVSRQHRPAASRLTSWLSPLILVTLGCLLACAGSLGSSEARRHYDLAVALHSRGEYFDAIDEYKLAIRESPKMVKAHFGLGVACIHEKTYPRAIQALNEAIALEPHYPEAYYNLGLARYHLEEYEEAERSLRVALEQAPGFADARRALAEIYEARGETELAIEAYESLPRVSDDLEATLALGRLYRLLGDPATAADHYESAAHLDSTRFDAWYELGLIREEQGRYEAAIEAYERTMAARPDDLDLLTRRARVYYLDDQPAVAVELYLELVARAPDQGEAYYNLGVAYDALGKPAEAILAYREVVRLEPGYADAHLNMGIDLLAEKRYDEALTACEEFLKLSDDEAKRTRVLEIVEELRAALGS